jgi:hypothetical protein
MEKYDASDGEEEHIFSHYIMNEFFLQAISLMMRRNFSVTLYY